MISLGALAGVLLGVGVWLHTDGGRAFVARRLESAITSRLQGTLRIASLDEISWYGLRARGVRFIAPNGDEVIVVNNVDMEVRWRSFLSGRFVSPSATVTGGRVLLHDDAHGTLSIDTTTKSRTPSPPDARRDGHGTIVELQHIDVRDVTLVVRVRDVPDMTVTNIRGGLEITVRDPGRELLLTLDHVRGRGRLGTPIPIHLRLTGGDFRYDSGSTERVRADVRAVLGDDRVRLRCLARMHRRDAQVALRLTLPSSAGPFENLTTIIQASVASLTSSHVDFSVSRN